MKHLNAIVAYHMIEKAKAILRGETEADSVKRVVRGIIVEWEAEADLLKSGNHPRRQNMPRTQVLQEECALRGCIADIKRVLDASNAKLTRGGDNPN